MSAPYIVVADVTAYLDNLDLNSVQTQVCEQKIDSAIAYANRVALQAWNLDPITNERYTLTCNRLALRNRPVASVQQIQVRSMIVGDTPQLLVAGVDYELLDPALGLVVFSRGGGGGSMALVDYTPNRPVPADIVEAVTMVAAHSLYFTLFNDRWGISQAEADHDAKVQYDGLTALLQVPAKADAIFSGYRPVIWG